MSDEQGPATSRIPFSYKAERGALMQLDPEEMEPVLKRLKRAQGQIGGIIRMLEEGRDCTEVVTQLAAVSKALDRAGFAVIAGGLRQCLLEETDDSKVDTATLEKLFLSLA
jgi:DNA-binding FrmR family transcriptional regulator